MEKIVLTGGGTAGHVIPHLALLPYLINKYEIHYIGSGGIEKRLMDIKGVTFHTIDAPKLRRKLTFKNFAVPFKLIKSIMSAKKLLQAIKPVCIFSKGGYVSLPVVLASKKIPVILHESDLSVGLANKLSMRKAHKIFTSFEKTAKETGGEYCGSPVRAELLAASRAESLAKFSLSGQKPVLLILGGSSGSKAVNEAVFMNIKKLVSKFDVLHQTGKGNKQDYTSPSYRQFEFIDDMAAAFSAADIVVSRAGSNTLFELLALNKPTLLIPLPRAESRGDQIQNADYMEQLGVMLKLDQGEASEKLYEAVCGLYDQRKQLKDRISAQKFPDGTKIIADYLLRYIKDKNLLVKR